VGAQQLALGGLGQQRPVERLDRLLAHPAGELGQRGRVWHLSAQGDAAEPLPADRVGDLAAQQLVAQPVAELQEHHPQVGVQRDRRPAQRGVEVRSQRGQKHRIVQQSVNGCQFSRQQPARFGQDRLPQRLLGVGGSQHLASNPLRHNRLRRSSRHSTHPSKPTMTPTRSSEASSARVLRGEVASNYFPRK
jgi:hypothetical protein